MCTRLAATEPIDRFRYSTVGASSRCSETIERGSPSSVSECGGFHSSPQGRERVVVVYIYMYTLRMRNKLCTFPWKRHEARYARIVLCLSGGRRAGPCLCTR